MPDAAENWLQENDPEGVAFEYEVLAGPSGIVPPSIEHLALFKLRELPSDSNQGIQSLWLKHGA